MEFFSLPANRWESQDLNPGSLTLEPVILINLKLRVLTCGQWQEAWGRAGVGSSSHNLESPQGMALLPLNLCPPRSTASCAAWSPTLRFRLRSIVSKGLSSIPSRLVGTQTPLPPWLGPLLVPTMGWNRCRRAGSKAVRAMRKQTSWPRACTGSSRRVCEGHNC